MLSLQKDVSLRDYSSLRIGGKAKYFALVKDLEGIKEAVQFAKKENIPFFVLGGGSNVLFLDDGYPGLIMKIHSFDETKIIPNESDDFSSRVIVSASVPLAQLVNISLNNGLYGLEWAAGIPGEVGGAVCGNAGAFGSSMSDIVTLVRAVNIQSPHFDLQEFSNKDCQFAYRDSFFKKNKNYIIFEVEMELKKGDKNLIENKIKENLVYRKNHQPLGYPSAGSIFKNVPLIPENQSILKISKRFPYLNKFKEKGFIPAAYLIDECGLRGKKIGGAQVAEKHSNFILNIDNAKAEDVIILISLIKQKVRNRFGIELEEEINLVAADTSFNFGLDHCN